MLIDEVFPRPTVKTVVFQIRFPNLFYIESKIGEIQLRIMDEFPDSSLQIRRNIVVADLGPNVSVSDLPPGFAPEPAKKIWQFRSPKGYMLNVSSDSVDLSSQYHKSYDRPEAESRFRDAIVKAVGSFLEVTHVPIISRIGLRYRNECPVPEKRTELFREWYATTFPLDRFGLEEASELIFKSVSRRRDVNLGYIEQLTQSDGAYVLVLDLDAFANDVRSEDYLETADKLHNVVVSEFGASIKQPVVDYMRQNPGE